MRKRREAAAVHDDVCEAGDRCTQSWADLGPKIAMCVSVELHEVALEVCTDATLLPREGERVKGEG